MAFDNDIQQGQTATVENILDDVFFEELRSKEYSRLDELRQTYLDFTGGNLYSTSQINKHQQMLMNNVMGNPHSTNPTSQLATKMVEEARQTVTDFFKADDYICVFTSNASGALKIVGESYPFTSDSAFVLLADNHNSVNGIRSYCSHKGGTVRYVQVQVEDLRIHDETLLNLLKEFENKKDKLFAIPAQSNVSGVKHDLKWIQIAHDLGYDVLLDAAAYVPSSRLDLSVIKPDFVSISFYKIFGYPTGIGCLLIHKDKFNKLEKPWFAGGTVKLVTVAVQDEILEEGHERFEDGTLNYLGIPAVKTGLDFINTIGIDRINQRVRSLTEYLIRGLKGLKHDNGHSLVKIFGPTDLDHRGGNVIINCYDQEGMVYAFDDIEHAANEHNISIRSGCFCNPGLDEIKSCVSNDELASYYVSRDNFSFEKLVATVNRMRGAIRISVGIATVQRDLDSLFNFLKTMLNR